MLPVTAPLRLAPAESAGSVVLVLSDAWAVLVAAGFCNWMAVTLTPIWLPVGKYPLTFGVDNEATLGVFKFFTPGILFTSVEVVATVVIDGFMLVAVAASGFWTASGSDAQH